MKTVCYSNAPLTHANMSRYTRYALYKVIEEGVTHMWTCSVLQTHKNCMVIADEDATLELKVKTVKYFKGLMQVTRSFTEEERRSLGSPYPI